MRQKYTKNSRLRIQPGHWIEYGKRAGKRSFRYWTWPIWTYISTRSRGKILKPTSASRDPNISRLYLSQSTWNGLKSLRLLGQLFQDINKSSPINHHQLHLAQALLVDQLDLRSLCFSLLWRLLRSGAKAIAHIVLTCFDLVPGAPPPGEKSLQSCSLFLFRCCFLATFCGSHPK